MSVDLTHSDPVWATRAASWPIQIVDERRGIGPLAAQYRPRNTSGTTAT